MNKLQSTGLIIVIAVNNMFGHDGGGNYLVPLMLANVVGIMLMVMGADE